MFTPPHGTYVENSALGAFLSNPEALGAGPFVLSEYSLAEKARLQPSEFRAVVLAAEQAGMKFLRVPPVTQLITGNLVPEWEGPLELVPIDVAATLEGQGVARERLDRICAVVAEQSADRYRQLRPHYADYLTELKGPNGANLEDPRPLKNRRKLVEAVALDSLGWEEPPGPDTAVSVRLRWALRSWEMAMVFVRLDRENHSARQLRNDPIDAVHHALASTFCSAIVTADRDMRRIREVVSAPRPALLSVTVDGAGGLAGVVRLEADPG